jgi:toxin ParE1/3/4
MATIKWTLRAKKDFQDLVEYIALDSKVYAAESGSRIVAAVEHLKNFPSLGRVVPEFEDGTLREIIVGNHRLVYHLNDKLISMVAIIHVSQDFLHRFGDDDV